MHLLYASAPQLKFYEFRWHALCSRIA